MPSLNKTDWRLMVLGLLLLTMMGCSRNAVPTNDSHLQITLLPPAKGRATKTLTVQVVDPAGKPIPEAKVGLEINMTHAGMAPAVVSPVDDAADGKTDGIYTLPFTFDMLGEWLIKVTVEKDGAAIAARQLDVEVGEQNVEIRP